MANRYYSEFDFYRKLLRIISSNRTLESKLRAIKCSIEQQFDEFHKIIRSHHVTVRIDGKDYF